MDARELQKLWHELVETALKNPNVEQSMRNLSFIISYLISEQDKRRELADKLEAHSRRLDQFDRDMLLNKITIEKIEASSKANGRMLRAILVAVISGIVIEGLKMLFHK